MNKTSLSRDQQDAIDLLIGELQQIVASSLDAPFTATDDRCALQHQLLELKHLSAAADIIGLQALQSIWHWLANNIQRLLRNNHFSDPEQTLLLDAWPAYFLDYLQQLRQGVVSNESLQPLASYLGSAVWVVPMEPVVWQQLQSALMQPDFSPDDKTAASKLPTLATAEMLSLALPDDLNADLFEGLMIELPGQVNQFAEAIERYLDQRHPDDLLVAQRVAHTVKGAANIVGIIGLANFMHFSEDLLEEIARCGLESNVRVRTLLMDMVDTLATLLDALLLDDVADKEALRVMQAVLDICHELRQLEPQTALSGNDASNVFVSSGAALHRSESIDLPVSVTQDISPLDADIFNTATDVNTAPDAISQKVDESPALITASAHSGKTTEKPAAQLRIREETAQDLLRLAGSSAIANNRLQSQVQDVKQQLQSIAQLHNKLVTLADDFGRLVDDHDGLADAHSELLSGATAGHIPHSDLHNFYQQLQEVVADARDATQATNARLRALDEQVWDQQRVHRESENLLLGMRMIPARNLEPRFQRCVRQASRLSGKQAQLVIEGGDTMIDSRVLHDIIDPLMHLLRNAVSHGIETTDRREAAGKPSQGCIKLQFHNLGQTIAIDVIDDGAGLDYEAIERRALSLGIILPPEKNVSSEKSRWLNQVIFSPGFSTYAEIDQTAGRGIGLDIVADSIASLKGKVSVDSSRGKGTHFTVRLPVKVISEPGLVVRQGEQQWAISARGVEQVLFLEAGQLEQQAAGWRYRFDNNWLNVYPISALAKTSLNTALPLAQHRALLVVESWPGQRAAVLVEQVVARKDMVVKPLTPYTPPVSGVTGATILGDGQVAPVLDLPHLLLEAISRNVNFSEYFTQLTAERPQKSRRPLALVVDDSLSARRALAQVVSDFGMEVHTAKDGFEAVDIMRDKVPDIVLLDMEMPRMNGLELTAHIRSNEPTRHVPVVMITSRNTGKHRHLAEVAGVSNYLSKPFSEDELVEYLQYSIRH